MSAQTHTHVHMHIHKHNKQTFNLFIGQFYSCGRQSQFMLQNNGILISEDGKINDEIYIRNRFALIQCIFDSD